MNASSDAALHSRVTYDAYGTASYRADGDLNRDGTDWDSDDVFEVWLATLGSIGSSAYLADTDINRDGEADVADLTVFTNSSGDPSALPGRVTVPTDDDGPDCNVGYAGYFQMPEIAAYSVRYRVYDPALGRWFQRDPAGYVDGLGLYEVVRSSPSRYLDPLGLASTSARGQGAECGSASQQRLQRILRAIVRNCGGDSDAGRLARSALSVGLATGGVGGSVYGVGNLQFIDATEELAKAAKTRAAAEGLPPGIVRTTGNAFIDSAEAARYRGFVTKVFGGLLSGLGVIADGVSVGLAVADGDELGAMQGTSGAILGILTFVPGVGPLAAIAQLGAALGVEWIDHSTVEPHRKADQASRAKSCEMTKKALADHLRSR